MRPLVSLALDRDEDVVAARRSAAHIGALLEFDVQEQTRIATAVSEIVRNAFRYATGGGVQFELDLDARPQQLRVVVEDGVPALRISMRCWAARSSLRPEWASGLPAPAG